MKKSPQVIDSILRTQDSRMTINQISKFEQFPQKAQTFQKSKMQKTNNKSLNSDRVNQLFKTFNTTTTKSQNSSQKKLQGKHTINSLSEDNKEKVLGNQPEPYNHYFQKKDSECDLASQEKPLYFSQRSYKTEQQEYMAGRGQFNSQNGRVLKQLESPSNQKGIGGSQQFLQHRKSEEVKDMLTDNIRQMKNFQLKLAKKYHQQQKSKQDDKSASVRNSLLSQPQSAKNQKKNLETIFEDKSNQPQFEHRKQYQQVNLEDFDLIKCIGLGGFSRVYLVAKKDTGKKYALKLIEKEFIIKNNKQVIIENERNIMTNVKHPFCLSLEFAFESKQYIGFVMEYCPGGELFYHLRKCKRMTEEDAKFFFVQILLGIKYLHEKNIIYRDIKPENILLDENGNIRIGDFGLSKPDMDSNEFAYSFCGSPEYMAPEMLLKVGHTYTVDYYCLGALLYELVTGLPPFYSQNTDEIYNSILSEELTFPDHVTYSPELKILLQGLLTKHPMNRLGYQGGVDEILMMPWFKSINMLKYLEKRVTPPIKPDLENFNFDEEEFSKGEKEFREKLIKSFKENDQDYPRIFKNFYYDNDLVLSMNQQINSKKQKENSCYSNTSMESLMKILKNVSAKHIKNKNSGSFAKQFSNVGTPTTNTQSGSQISNYNMTNNTFSQSYLKQHIKAKSAMHPTQNNFMTHQPSLSNASNDPKYYENISVLSQKSPNQNNMKYRIDTAPYQQDDEDKEVYFCSASRTVTDISRKNKNIILKGNTYQTKNQNGNTAGLSSPQQQQNSQIKSQTSSISYSPNKNLFNNTTNLKQYRPPMNLFRK